MNKGERTALGIALAFSWASFALQIGQYFQNVDFHSFPVALRILFPYLIVLLTGLVAVIAVLELTGQKEGDK